MKKFVVKQKTELFRTALFEAETEEEAIKKAEKHTDWAKFWDIEVEPIHSGTFDRLTADEGNKKELVWTTTSIDACDYECCYGCELNHTHNYKDEETNEEVSV